MSDKLAKEIEPAINKLSSYICNINKQIPASRHKDIRQEIWLMALKAYQTYKPGKSKFITYFNGRIGSRLIKGWIYNLFDSRTRKEQWGIEDIISHDTDFLEKYNK